MSKPAREVWMKDTNTMEDLQQNMVRFLNGELDQSPWHLSPIMPETVPIMKDVRALNELGFVTIEGQPGTFKFPVRHYETNEILVDEYTGYKYLEYQHGYSVGFLDSRKFDISGLLKELDNTPHIAAFIYKFNDGTIHIKNKPDNNDIEEMDYDMDNRTTDVVNNKYYLTLWYLSKDGKQDEFDEEDSITIFDIDQFKERAISDLQFINKDLKKDIIDNAYFVTFINNKTGTIENLTEGLGLEKDLYPMLEKSKYKSKSKTSTTEASSSIMGHVKRLLGGKRKTTTKRRNRNRTRKNIKRQSHKKRRKTKRRTHTKR